MKKILTAFTVLFVYVLMLVPAYADGAMSVELDCSEEAEKVVLTVSVSHNPGFAGFNAAVKYDDSIMTPISIKKGEVLSKYNLISNLQQGIALSGSVTACVINPSNITDNGELYSVVFKKLEKDAEYEFTLSFDDKDIVNQNREGVKVNLINNTLKNTPETDEPVVDEGSNTEGSGESNGVSKPTTTKPPKTEITVVEPEKKDDLPEQEIKFTDVKQDDWFYESVAWGYKNNLITGVTQTEFAPYNDVTRAMLVTMLYRYSQSKSVFGGEVFGDVPQTEWYYNSVMWAYKNKLVNGVGNNNFAPNDNITREQAAKILYEFAGLQKMNTATKGAVLDFSDSEKISDWAYDAMCWAVENEYINGRGEKILAPQGNANRAEIITILKRFLAN